MSKRITWDFAPVAGRNVSSHCRQRARDSLYTRHLWVCPGESPGTSHLSLGATSQATADNAHETVATQDSYGPVLVKHLGLRTCDWTQRHKPHDIPLTLMCLQHSHSGSRKHKQPNHLGLRCVTRRNVPSHTEFIKLS